MGRHIKRVQEFNYTEELNNIINKFKKSGYFSKNDQQLLANLSGCPNFVEEFDNKLEDIIKFFNKYDPMEFENILMDIFDECYYILNVSCSIYPLDTKEIWQSDVRELVNLGDQTGWEIYWNNIPDKMSILVPEILSKLNYGKIDPKYSWKKEKNYLKLATKLQPKISVSIIHRDYPYGEDSIFPEWNEEEEYLNQVITKGITYHEYKDNDNKLAKKIGNRLSLFTGSEAYTNTNITPSPIFTPLKVTYEEHTEEGGWRERIYQSDYGIVTEEKKNRILLSGKISILFKIN